jgi:curved DNA-binding protein
MVKDFCQILGGPENASEEEIKEAYRKLAVKFHPDENQGNRQAEEKFKEISEANEILSSADKRKKFDQWGKNRRQFENIESEQGFSSFPFSGQRTNDHQFFHRGDTGSFFSDRNYSDIFSSLSNISGSNHRKEGPDVAHDVSTRIDITLEEAYHGTTRQIKINGKRLKITIKPGVYTGQVLRIKDAMKDDGFEGKSRDLYMHVKVRKHPIFERKGDDLNYTISLDLCSAILGVKTKNPITRRGFQDKYSVRYPIRGGSQVEREGNAHFL